MSDRICTKCGAPLSGGTRFCTECGELVTPQGASDPDAVVKLTPSSQAVSYSKPTPTSQGTGMSSGNAAQQRPTPAQPQSVPASSSAAQSASGYSTSGQGGSSTSGAVPTPASRQAYASAASANNDVPDSKSKYQPLSTGGFIGSMFLMAIPVLGWIIAIIWALGGCRKINKRNLARAYLILFLIGLILSLITGIALRGPIKTVITEIKEGTGIFALVQDGELSKVSELLSILDKQSGDGDSSDGQDTSDPSWTSSGGGSIDDLLDGVDNANKDAEQHSNGWPSELPDYPGGTMNAVADYRTTFTGTTADEMKSYIETLKSQGYYYKDFYDFGMTETDMLGANAWWGTNDKLYISMSFVDGTVTIDHLTQLPDLDSYFG